MAILSVVTAAADTAPADANPYSVISDRNIFHLNPPPPPPDPDAAKAVDVPKVMLTGFVGKGNTMKVLMAVLPKDKKDSVSYLTLKPGEKDHDVELVNIHLDKEEVDIINTGTAQTLSVKSNSYASAAPATPQPGGAPAMPGLPGIRHPMAGFPAASPQPAATPATASAASSGGSAIVVAGGGGGESGSASGSSGNGAIVSGGNASVSGGNSFVSGGNASVSGGNSYASGGNSYVPGMNANNAGGQIANSLFNQNSQYRMPPAIGTPAPKAVQAAGLLIQEAAGGPPSPVQSSEDGGPPAIP
jgi:hypothetical protein